MTEKSISDIGEKELIRILLNKRDKKLVDNDNLLHESYHDDAALIENSGKYTVVSTDLLIQHSHFPGQMTFYQMGAKAVTVNVSDIIAMNAKATSILISMGLPPDMTLNEYDELTDGILDKCSEYDVRLIGGDINKNTEVVLGGTAIGKVEEEVKLQKGIGMDDYIAVTGELGGPAASLDLLNSGLNLINSDIVKTLLEPGLPLKESELFRKYPLLTTSMTDITDGLAVELGHLMDKNPGIGFEIYFDKIPYDESIVKIAEDNDKNLTDYLLHFGEEFELLVTLNAEEYDKHKEEFDNLYIIGKSNDTGRITLEKDGESELIPVRGYEHLKE